VMRLGDGSLRERECKGEVLASWRRKLVVIHSRISVCGAASNWDDFCS
jgi:hypothetical protein